MNKKMLLRSVSFLCAVLCSASAFASDVVLDADGLEVSDGATVTEPLAGELTETTVRRRWGVRIGRGMLFEKSNSTKADIARLSFLAGADIEWALASSTIGFGVEYGRFGSADGNQTIQVASLNESLLAWADLGFSREGSFVPYVGGGFGVSRLTAETQLSGMTEKSTGLWLPVGAARVGVLAAWNAALRLRAEARFETAQELKTNDARLGVALSLQYLFGHLN